MILKPIVVCLYLALAYWLSSQNPMLKMLFFPTLAAIAFFFMSRATQLKELFKVSAAAIVASTIGSIFFFLHSGVLSFLITCLLTISFILICKINAAPVLAVAVIPFFAHPPLVWLFPVSIIFTLAGLVLVLWSCQRLEVMLAKLLLVSSAKKRISTEEISS